MPEAVARVGPRCSAARTGVDEIDLVQDRTADSMVRFEAERVLDRALIDLEASLDMMVVSICVGARSLIHTHAESKYEQT
jgi:hypothetical protein